MVFRGVSNVGCTEMIFVVRLIAQKAIEHNSKQ